jgi:membrane protease YdiL (CAAX protease family)
VDLPSRIREPRLGRSTLILGLYGALSLAAFAIGGLRHHGNLYQLDGSRVWKLILSPPVGVLVALGIVFLSRLSVHRFDWARNLHRDFRGLVGALSARDTFVLALASSVGEELFFRGALLPWIGLWASAGIFAALHIGPSVRYLPWTLSAFLVGLLFGSLALLLGDLGAPIVAHFTVNYLNLEYIIRTDLPA